MDIDFSESLNDTLIKLPNKSLFLIQIKSKARLIGLDWLVLGSKYNIMQKSTIIDHDSLDTIDPRNN